MYSCGGKFPHEKDKLTSQKLREEAEGKRWTSSYTSLKNNL
jgi:hypothetical protein